MTPHPGLLFTLLAFALMLGPLIFFHELGHYLAGRLFGVKAETFSIGFGRELVGWTDRQGTRWKLAWIPLGGYVKFAGDMNPASQPDPDWLALPAAERARTFQAKKLWQRAIIVAAGPITNFILAVLIFAGMAMVIGANQTSSVIGQVEAGSPAATAGLRSGDRLTALSGWSVDSYADVASYTVMHPGQRVRIEFERDGQRLSAETSLATVEQRDRFGNSYKRGRLGVGPAKPVFSRLDPIAALGFGLRETGAALATTLDGLGQMITGRRGTEDLGGVIGIAKVSGEQLATGWPDWFWLVAMISINLGFINLLPVPVLDGGHLFFYAIEAVRRRPLTPAAMEWAFRGGLAAIFALMLMATISDLGRVGLWKGLAGLIG